MRRALSQLCQGTTGASWLAQLGAASHGCAARCAGEASTSYGVAAEDGNSFALVRGLAGKAAAKGKGAPAPPPPPAAPRPPPGIDVLASAGARLRRRRAPSDPLALLTPHQRDLAETLLATPSTPPDSGAEGAAAAAAGAVAEGGGAVPPPLRGLGQIGLPLDRRDVASLLQQSLSGAADQNVHFQPFVFSNVFQSAPAVASYVAAALESGTPWSRVERFFLAAVEADHILRGVKVEVRGRIGRKADMASCKKWEWGDLTRRVLSDPVDYGAAPAFTRLGVLGVKVWIRYKNGAVPELFYPAKGGSHHRTATPAGAAPSLGLDELYGAAVTRSTRVALPYTFSAVGWWERTWAEQPAENRVSVSELFTPDFDPAAGDRLDSYLQRRREEGRRFRSAAERVSYLETTGRFLAKQRRMAQIRRALQQASGTAAAGPGAGAPAPLLHVPLGRRPNRTLGRFRTAPGPRGRMASAVLRHRVLLAQRRDGAAKRGFASGKQGARDAPSRAAARE